MSSGGLPLRSEVMEWSLHSLADYMKRHRLLDCDKVVMRDRIDGARFLNMTLSDLQRFPSIQVPIITKICSEINSNKGKKGFGRRSQEPTYPHQGFVQEEKEWDSEKSDESDHDYEQFDSVEVYVQPVEDTYECPLEPKAKDKGEIEEYSDDNYEAPPSGRGEELPRILSMATPLDDSDYIDSPHAGLSAKLPAVAERSRTTGPPRFPSAAKRDSHARPTLPRLVAPSPSRTASKLPPCPGVDRTTKPGRPRPPGTNPAPSKEGSHLSHVHPPMGRTGLKPPNPRHIPPQPLSNPVSNPTQHAGMGMDSRWYGGRVSRGLAEGSLRQVNKDGAFLVRDSSKGSSGQPYTLMVLYQSKVFNIQIRQQDNKYSLGTGLKGIESFPAVPQMIAHYRRSPLVLIDTMQQDSGYQSQCCLLHPAGQ